MICLNFEHAKNPNYLGPRVINRNSITMGPNGNIYVEADIFPCTEIKIKIQNDKLIFEPESGTHYLNHNGKRTKLPIVASIGDKIEFDSFRIAVQDFKKVKYTSYRNFTNQALEDTKDNPQLMKLVSQLTSFLD